MMEETRNRELCILKVFKAPVDFMWEAWTNPKHLVNWWGPNGFTITIHKMDLQEGGEWNLTLHGQMEQTIQTGAFSRKLFR